LIALKEKLLKFTARVSNRQQVDFLSWRLEPVWLPRISDILRKNTTRLYDTIKLQTANIRTRSLVCKWMISEHQQSFHRDDDSLPNYQSGTKKCIP